MTQFKINAIISILVCILLCFPIKAENYYPSQSWQKKTAQSQGLNQVKVNALFDSIFEDSSTQAVVLIKNGYIVKERYAKGFTKDDYSTSWSVAKSFYASLLGVLIEQKKASLNDLEKPLTDYISSPSLYDLLAMSSGFYQNKNEHEEMFFTNNQLNYARRIYVDKMPNTTFEYNNVNSMRLGELIETISKENARKLLISEIIKPIGITDFRIWQDPSGNALSYCCIDMSPRDYARFGLLFSRDGRWNNKQLINKKFIKQSTKHIWAKFPHGYGLHWWIADKDIFYASGRFGQAIIVSPKDDLVLVKTTKYFVPKERSHHMNLDFLGKLTFLPLEWRIKLGILYFGLNPNTKLNSPITTKEGSSTLWYKNFDKIIKQIKYLKNEYND